MLIMGMLAPLATLPRASAGYHEEDWYKKVNGVLTTDYYDLYPFAEQSVDFGFSKFGELIYWNESEGYGVGLQYPGFDAVKTYVQDSSRKSVDPFANEMVNEWLWLNGWLLEVRYTHRSHGDRCIRAMAMFADMDTEGGDWIVGFDENCNTSRPFTDAPHGGRKVTSYATTEDILELYDGPRRYVAMTVTHIYDWKDSNGNDEIDLGVDSIFPVVDVIITYVFNKVKKEVMLIKDIKQVITGKELDSPIDIQFSNREEWDLGAPGTETEYGSYAHWWHQEMPTCYGAEWHMAPGIMREFEILMLAHGSQQEFCIEEYMGEQGICQGCYGLPIVRESDRVYVKWLTSGSGSTAGSSR
jgi:hypothetical protein